MDKVWGLNEIVKKGMITFNPQDWDNQLEQVWPIRIMLHHFDKKDKTEKNVIGAVMWSDRGELLDVENKASSNFG